MSSREALRLNLQADQRSLDRCKHALWKKVAELEQKTGVEVVTVIYQRDRNKFQVGGTPRLTSMLLNGSAIIPQDHSLDGEVESVDTHKIFTTVGRRATSKPVVLSTPTKELNVEPQYENLAELSPQILRFSTPALRQRHALQSVQLVEDVTPEKSLPAHKPNTKRGRRKLLG